MFLVHPSDLVAMGLVVADDAERELIF